MDRQALIENVESWEAELERLFALSETLFDEEELLEVEQAMRDAEFEFHRAIRERNFVILGRV